MRGNAPQGGTARAEGHVIFSPRTSRQGRRKALLAGTAMALLAAAGTARAGSGPTLPTGGAFQAGSGSITSGPGSLTVNQGSQRAVIDWKSFSIGQGGTVSFNNGSGATLNRVTGGNLSTILGTLKATGTLYVINPAGVVVGASGVVVTGGSFTASTLDIANDAFMAGGTLLFKGDTDAEVKNLGKISATGGDVFLIARSVTNDGTITAPNGTVGLAAGQQVLLKDGDAGERVYVQVGGPGGSGDVTNTGAIAAAQAELKAAGGNIYALAGNGGGVIRATGTMVKDGHIWLSASGSTGAATDQGGTVTLAGTVATTNADGTGGTVIATAKSVAVQAGAVVDASGTSGAGGTILLGGDRQGGADAATKLVKQTVATAAKTTVAAGATLKADAGAGGDGGSVIVWSDQETRFAGALSAKGGPRTGKGGFAEVSSHKLLDFTGTVDLTAPLGRVGQLLLDPENVTISTGSNLNSSQSGGTFTPTGASSVINTTTLQNALSTADVTITTGTIGSQAGDITIANNVTWSASHSLTLSAYRNIVFNGGTLSHTAGSGDVTLRADNTGTGSGTVTFTSGAVAMSGSSGSVKLYYNPSGYASPTSYTGNVTLGSGSLTAYMLVNSASNLQNLSSNLSGTYALGRDIDASITRTWNSGAGFIPINSFAGTLDGLGHTVTGLTINRPTTVAVGLFGDTPTGNGPRVSNLGLVNVNITGSNRVGGIVGRANGGGSLDNVYVTGTITGYGDFIGGLIGQDDQQSISNSWTDVAITVPKGYSGTGVGGLVGWQRLGALTNVYALGDVYAPDSSRVGGLVGTNGFIGAGQGAGISNAYATGKVTGNDSVGGLIGISEGGSIATSYATGAVSGVTNVGGLVGVNANPITTSWASGAVSLSSGSATSVGGLVGTNGDSVSAGSIATSYWDSFSTGQSTAVGAVVGGSTASATAVTSDPAQAAAANYAFKAGAYGSLNFSTGWTTVGDVTRPMGQWEYSTSISSPHQLQLMAMDTTAAYTLARDITMPTNSVSSVWGTAGFAPIASGGSGFTGSLDGQQHTVANLTISRPNDGRVGLFGYLGTGGSVSNLGLVNASITGQNDVGILAGVSDGTISGSYTTGSVTSVGLAGGLVGVLGSSSTPSITTSYSAATVSTGAGLAAGGLVGSLLHGSISDSYATGAVSGNGEVGGLVGVTAGSVTISRAYASGAVSSADTTMVGGLIGLNAGGTFTDLYWDVGTTGQAASVGSAGSAATGVTGLATSAARTQGSYTGFDFTNTWYIVAGSTRPFLRSEYSTTIHTAHQLQLIGTALTANYTLANDIDLASLTTTPSDIWAGGTFSPIGSFSGSFSGGNHTISGLTLTGSANNRGLFSQTSGGSLSDLTLTNVSVSGGNNVGALVGAASGTAISNITVSGTVSGASQVGGVVGSATAGSIRFAGMSGTISATADSIGGVVGFTNGAISDSWSTATVSSSGTSSHGLYVGGLVGQSAGTIDRSWASGAVSGWTDVGGLAGLAAGNITTSGASGSVTGGGSVIGGLVGNLFGASLTNTYATGAVTGFQEEGGLVGIIQAVGTTITNSYASGRVSSSSGSVYNGGLVGLSAVTFTASNSFWDVTTTGQSFGSVSGGAGQTVAGFTGMTGTQGFTSTTFSNAGWDLTNTWYMVDGATRPMLQAEASATLRSAHQLQLVNLNPSIGYTLANDIDLGGALSATGGAWGSGGFSPIDSFAGTFNGGGHTISGLTINTPGSTEVGLFGALSGTSHVHDLTLSTVSITGGSDVGALAGNVGGGAISHVTVTGSITGGSTVGGLIGSVTSGALLQDTKADILITASGTDVGGLVGNSNGTIQDSYTLGGIRMTAAGSAQSVGGLVGTSSGTIADDYAQVALLGAVRSGSAAGGLVGTNSGTVARTYSIGALALTGTTARGGLIGNNIGTASNSFYDTETSGLSVGVGGGTTSGVTGKTTAQMQTRGTFTGAGWDYTTPVWGMIDGTTLPYFTWEHAGGVQIVTGTAYSDAAGSTFATANRVSALTNGTSLGSGFAGANGYYYILADGSPITGGNLVAYLNPALGNTTLGNAVHLTTSGGTTTGLSVLGNTVQMTSDGPAASTSALASARPSGIDSSLLYTVSGGTITLAANANLDIEAGSAAITIDNAVTLSGTGTLTLASTGTSTQSAAITTPSLLLTGSGGVWQLGSLSGGNSINNIGTLAANTGSILVGSGGALAVGTVGSTNGITLTGGLGFTGANTSVTQTQAISAGGLALEGGSYTLTNAGNAVTHFTANGATFSVVTSGAVTVDSVTAGGTSYDGLTLSGTGSNSLTAGGNLTVATPTNTATLAAGGALTLTAGGDLTITDTSLAVGSGSGASTLTLVAGNNVTLQGTSSAITVNGIVGAGLDLSLYADSDSSGAGGITLSRVNILTKGGTLALVGGAVVSDPTTAGNAHSTGNSATDDAAISITNSAISLEGGNAVLKGDGQASVTGTSSGIVLTNSSLTTTGTGTLALTGSATTSTAAGAHVGIQLVDGTLQTAAGDITLTGTAAAGPGGNTGLLVNGGGVTATTGGITLTGTGTGGTGLRLYGETLSTTSGAIALAGSGTTGAGLVLGDGTSTAASIGSGTQTGAITLTSDDFALSSGAAPTITTTGTVILRQQSADRALALSGSVTGADVLSAAGINGVTAGTLVIGRTDISETAGYTIAGAIAPTNVTTLSLATGGAITQSSGATITATSLAVRAAGDIGLATATNSVGTLAASTSAGSVSFKDSGALTVGTVDGLNGVTATTAVQLTAGAGSLLTVSQAVSGGTGVTLTADRMALASTVSATSGGTVQLGTATTSGWNVDLGSTGDATASTLELSSAELNRITASSLTISGAGITISGAIAPSTVSTLNLTATGAIAQTSGSTLTVGTLGLTAGGAITLDQANSVGTLAASATGAVTVVTTGALTIGTVGGTSGVSGTTIALTSGAGSLMTISSGITGTGVTLTADRVNLTGSVTATGTVTLAPVTSGWTVDLGSTSDATSGTLELSAAELDRVTAGTLVVDPPVSGDIVISAAIAPAHASTLVLEAGGTITQASGATITVGSLGLNAGGAITLTQANSVGTLAAIAGGAMALTNAGALTIGTAGGVSGITATGGVTITTSGTLTLANAVTSQATGDAVTLSTTGAFINAAGASAITAVSGRWLVYSATSAGDTFGNLDSGNTALWNRTLASGAVTASGNRYVFAEQPTLVITASDASKTYGQDVSGALSYTLSGGAAGVAHAYLGGASLGTAPTLTSTGAGGGATVGGYTIMASGATTTDGSAISYVAGTLTVNKAALTVTANNATVTYGQTPSLGASYSGFVNGDTAAVLGGSLAIGGAGTNAGSYTLTPGGLTAANYDISYVAGTLTVNKAALTVTANNATVTYGQTPSLGASYSGFVNGDTAAVLGGSLAIGGAGTNAGSYTLTPGGLTAANYDISYVAGTLTVNKAALTVTANNTTVTYGQTPSLGASYSGFVNGDTAAVLGGSLAIGGAGTNAGSYTLTPGGLTAANYDISYIAGTLTVNKAALTVTANNATVTYGQTPSLGASYSGFVNGDTTAVLGGSLAIGGAGTNAGSYTLTPGGLTAANYDISYVAGTLTVNKAALTVTANNATVTYGQTPSLGASYSGFVNGETAAVLGGSLAIGGAGTNAGSYTLTPGGLTAANYDISYVAGTLTVNKAALTVTANNATVTYGQTPSLGASYSGFVNGDTTAVLGGSLAIGGAGTNAGSYTLTPGGLTAANYDISYVAGTLTVNKAALTVTANNATVTYGQTPSLGASYSGFVNGDTTAVLGGSLAIGGAGTNAGSYTLTPGGLTAANYDISYVAGTLTVNRAPLTVTANDVTIAFGGTPAYSARYSGFVNGETAAVLGGSLVYNGGGTAAGTYTITPGGLTSGNYLITYVAGTLTVQADTSTPVVVPEVPSSTHFVDQPSGKVPFTPTQPLVGSDYSQGNYRVIYLAPPATASGTITNTSTFSAAHQDGTDETEFEIAKRWR
ncbi:MBG domain-containing protein [Nitrospirillum sp. BR 11164]|uniref:MBG domain-containing protein n=1 Tax=Nitrospirillum sp. BR 11164 TaxID=3104324 RepID=UPI002AFF17D0|nr:MBG domain-containing protein [Nitrospirillum sp. BR 11164]MEA1648103.1 MBG domain-containing protein [Nitrospirillum sp. BR 11164]